MPQCLKCNRRVRKDGMICPICRDDILDDLHLKKPIDRSLQRAHGLGPRPATRSPGQLGKTTTKG